MRQTQMSFPSAGATLAGTFATPDTDGPFPAALLLPGSGPLDRDGNMKRIRLDVSRGLATVLADHGWASYRYDKRGVGDSRGDYLSTGFADELADAAAALSELEARADVTQVVVIGHSAGAVHAVSRAGREPAIAGAVLLAATAKTGEDTLRWQARKMGDDLVPGPVKALMRLFRTDVLKQQDSTIAKLKASGLHFLTAAHVSSIESFTRAVPHDAFATVQLEGTDEAYDRDIERVAQAARQAGLVEIHPCSAAVTTPGMRIDFFNDWNPDLIRPSLKGRKIKHA